MLRASFDANASDRVPERRQAVARDGYFVGCNNLLQRDKVSITWEQTRDTLNTGYWSFKEMR